MWLHIAEQPVLEDAIQQMLVALLTANQSIN
jgi:hypothetical protein